MLSKIYKYSPVFLQNMYISLYGYYWKNRRYGGCFIEKIHEFKLNEHFSKEEWTTYQKKELRKLLIHAFKNVPFYRDLYTKEGFTLKDFECFEISDLKKIPFLEKDDLRKFGTTSLLSIKKEKGTFYKSSGSTGTPTQIYFSKQFHQKWSALYESRVRNWAGVDYKMSRAMIGGRRIIPTAIVKPPFYRYNFVEKQAYFSAYHITEKTCKNYNNELHKISPDYLVGYAKSIFLLAKMCNNQGLSTPKLKAVLTSSEKLTVEMRNEIETAFNCKVYDAYSGMEACGLISEDCNGDMFFSPDSGILEVLNENGNDVEFGESGEVVSTGFLNYDQPLIRYRIGDSVKLAKNQKSKSKLNMLKVEEIEGRNEDVIIGLNGQKMVRFHSVFINISSITMAQIIQKSLSEIEIKLVIDNYYNKKSEVIMRDRIQSQLGKIAVNFVYVNEIEKTLNGKYKGVISKLNND